MPARDDDDLPKKPVPHVVGQDLAALSLEELKQRVVILEAEIARIQADITTKQGSRSAADAFFNI